MGSAAMAPRPGHLPMTYDYPGIVSWLWLLSWWHWQTCSCCPAPGLGMGIRSQRGVSLWDRIIGGHLGTFRVSLTYIESCAAHNDNESRAFHRPVARRGSCYVHSERCGLLVGSTDPASATAAATKHSRSHERETKPTQLSWNLAVTNSNMLFFQ